MEGEDFWKIHQCALRLGEKVASLHGKNSVHDKPTPDSVCATIGLPF